MRKGITFLVALFVMMGQLLAENEVTYLNFTAVNGDATVALDSIGNPYQISLQYSVDKCSSWKQYTIGEVIQLSSGSTVYFKATTKNANFSNLTGYALGDYYYYSMTGSVSADGNIMSLLDASMQQTTVPDYAFRFLFNDCVSLTQAPLLPATTMGQHCYDEMFSGCTSLTKAPALPATNLDTSCYHGMFEYCTSLTLAPVLPATTLFVDCYALMFLYCRSLTQAPALPATTMATKCYHAMFGGCVSLTQAPALPATNMADHCYWQMFDECTSLTQAPALPATTMAPWCYTMMFDSCTALTETPALPATTMAPWCYAYMFMECSSLEKIPNFPVTTLADLCFEQMFKGCSSLKVNVAPPGSVWKIPSNADDSNANNWNDGMFDETGGTFTDDPVKGTDYYVAGGIVGVEEVEEDMDFTIAPNPVRAGEKIVVNGNFSDEELNGMTVEVIDLSGMVVRRSEVSGSPIQIEGVDAAGTYIIRITTGRGKAYTQKVIVE